MLSPHDRARCPAHARSRTRRRLGRNRQRDAPFVPGLDPPAAGFRVDQERDALFGARGEKILVEGLRGAGAPPGLADDDLVQGEGAVAVLGGVAVRQRGGHGPPPPGQPSFRAGRRPPRSPGRCNGAHGDGLETPPLAGPAEGRARGRTRLRPACPSRTRLHAPGRRPAQGFTRPDHGHSLTRRHTRGRVRARAGVSGACPGRDGRPPASATYYAGGPTGLHPGTTRRAPWRAPG